MPARSNFLNDANAYEQSLVPLSRSAGAANGSAINLLGTTQYEEGLAVFNFGAATGTPTTQAHVCKLQESADGSTGWADITELAEVSEATVTADADNAVKKIAFYPGAVKQYVRAVVTVAFTGGSSPAVPLNAQIILGKPKRH